MDVIFMNSESSGDLIHSHRVLVHLADKTYLKRSDKFVALSNLSIYYTWKKILKIHAKIINLKYQLQHGMNSLNYLMVYIHSLYQTFKIILSIYYKKQGEKTDKPSIRIYVDKIENKIKTGYYLELLMPEMGKLLGSPKSKIVKDQNGANMSYLDFTEVVLIHCNIVNKTLVQLLIKG